MFPARPCHGSVNLPGSVTTLTKVRQWETKIFHLRLRPKMMAGENWVGYRNEEVTNNASQMEEHGPPDDGPTRTPKTS